MMHWAYLNAIQQKRCKDLLREAENEQLVWQAQAQHAGPTHFVAQVMDWLGHGWAAGQLQA